MTISFCLCVCVCVRVAFLLVCLSRLIFLSLGRVRVEFYVNENTLKERLHLYFIKNQRSSESDTTRTLTISEFRSTLAVYGTADILHVHHKNYSAFTADMTIEFPADRSKARSNCSRDSFCMAVKQERRRHHTLHADCLLPVYCPRST